MGAIKTPTELIQESSNFYKEKGEPAREYNIIYNTTSEILEPVYFWILDYLGGPAKVDKLVDNFASAPGSARFSEFMGKASSMQKQAMEIYGTVNTVIKSILNLVYSLKEFQLVLKSYDDLASNDKNKKQSAILSLKQRWMDQVDIKKGTGSINLLSRDLNFVTLRDAFMAADNLKEVEQLDLNDRVKRILKVRIEEFLEWQKRSEVELKKRFEIEKTYLKTQVNTLKLYSKWVKPYLKMAQELSMNENPNAALVKAFNTMNMEIVLFKKDKIDAKDEAVNHNLPEEFRRINLKRNYYKCILVSFNFRGIPTGAQFVGKADVNFKAYALNEDELKLFKAKLDESELSDALNFIQGATDESLGQLKSDIEYFIEGGEEKEQIKKAEEFIGKDVNPFLALFGFGSKKPEFKKTEDKSKKQGEKEKEKKEIEELKKGIKKDNYAESVLRDFAEKSAIDSCFNVYDVYKKTHGMASTPELI